jgi:hypothetical protein
VDALDIVNLYELDVLELQRFASSPITCAFAVDTCDMRLT